ncbi:UBAP1-MVB12-associated (UMA)-domain containing protein 1 [Lethenteron reissneri]|uniref:UBAP1-MVB12-associated (UMA)-domain containing protein 1 n=1 Tax=Lethenteron reissneri TaxID=7753 RepID=UPI002AB74163|nr:UBAP1-MVB12-associated (UMA)-domain containing protein 1 [Lethenteron reissneri]
MLSSLFGKRNKEPTSIAPATTEKEDGGFVLLGDASAAAVSAGQAMPAHLYPPPLYAAQPGQAATGGSTAAAGGGPAQQSGEAAHPLSWLHGVPFSLAPRYQLGRQGQQDPPSSVFVQLSQADESLKSYAYDFALERSVLCSS